jgi:hypothetical protein
LLFDLAVLLSSLASVVAIAASFAVAFAVVVVFAVLVVIPEGDLLLPFSRDLRQASEN